WWKKRSRSRLPARRTAGPPRATARCGSRPHPVTGEGGASVLPGPLHQIGRWMRDRDYTTSVDFLGWLFEQTEGPVELRAIRDEGGATSTFTRAPEVVVTFCARHDGPGRGVYFGTATRTAGTAKGDRE